MTEFRDTLIKMMGLADNFKYPLIIGILTGTIISCNAFIAYPLHIRYSDLLVIQYLPSFVFAALLISLYVFITYSKFLWQKKETILIVTLVMSSQTKSLTSLGSLDLSDIATLCILLIWLVKNFTNIKYNVIISPLSILIIIFISTMMFSSMSVIASSRGSLMLMLGPVKWFLMMFLMMNFLRTKEDALFLMKTFIIATFLSGMIGIAESLLYSTTGFALHTGKYDFEETSFGPMLRAQAFFGHIHGLATILTVSLAFLFMLLLYFKADILWKKRTVIVMAVITGVAMFLTFYKGSWMAFGTVAILGLYIRKPAYTIHITLALLLGFTLMLSTGMVDKIQGKIDEELYVGDFKARRLLDKGGIEGFLHGYTLTGTGYGNNRIYVTHPKVYPAHNAFIQVADELGLTGLIGYCLIYVYLFYRLILACLLLHREDEKVIVQGLLISFIAFFIIAQFEPLAFNFWFWLYFAVLECVTYIFLKNRRSEFTVMDRAIV